MRRAIELNCDNIYVLYKRFSICDILVCLCSSKINKSKKICNATSCRTFESTHSCCIYLLLNHNSITSDPFKDMNDEKFYFEIENMYRVFIEIIRRFSYNSKHLLNR